MADTNHQPAFPPIPQRADEARLASPIPPPPPAHALQPRAALELEHPSHVRTAEPRRRGRIVTWILAGCLVLTLAGGAYLGVLARAWNQRAGELDSVVEQQSARITSTEEDLAVSQAELKETADQLSTAQQRITELANEKAQAGDDQAATAQLLDYQQRVSTAAGQVASALGECITGQENLIKYLKDPARYDPDSLASYQSQVEQFCEQAVEANSTLQQELQK